MKKRITALALVLLICLAYCGSTFALGALSTQAGAQSGYQYASIISGQKESLSVSFILYKIENGKPTKKASGSASNNGSTSTVTAKAYETLPSGSYEMHISGGSSSHPISEVRYITL